MSTDPLSARRQRLFDLAQDAHDVGRAKGGKFGPGPWAMKYAAMAISTLSDRDSPVSTAEAEGYVGLALGYAEQSSPGFLMERSLALKASEKRADLKAIMGKVWANSEGKPAGQGLRYELRLELDRISREAQPPANPKAWSEPPEHTEESA